MVKVKVIKNGLIYPKGKILNVSKIEADDGLKNGDVEIINEVYVAGIGNIETEVNPKQFIELEDGTIKDVTEQNKKIEEAKWSVGKRLLDELIIKDGNFEKDKWGKYKNGYLGGRVTFERWEKYWKERNNKEEIEEEKVEIKGVTGLTEKKVSVEDIKNIIKNLIFKREEDEATEYITEHIIKNNFIYTTRDDIKSEIWYYDNGIYIPNGKSLIKEITRKLLEDAYTPQRVNKVIAKVEADTQIEHDNFFVNTNISEIPIKNGILDVLTRKIKPFTHEKIFFNKLPIVYNPDAKCDNIIKFFSDVLKDEGDVRVMFELIGFCLVKDYKFEKAFMFIGNGRNGKGKTLSLMKRFLGVQNCSSIPLAQINSGSTSVCELYGRLANIAGDLSNTDLKDTGMFKQITGRDLITAKRKYLRDLFFENYAKVIFACNELPKVYDLSDGFWSRWVLFEFPYKFVKKEEFSNQPFHKIMDEDIINKISDKNELSGLLNMALDGLERLFNNHGFSYSKGTEAVKDLWIRKSDSFTAFCIDNIKEDIDGKIPKKNLRKAFSNYCKKNKIMGASDKAIKVTLENRYGAYEYRDWEGSRELYWEGIRFK